jgi:hypothetical protein
MTDTMTEALVTALLEARRVLVNCTDEGPLRRDAHVFALIDAALASTSNRQAMQYSDDPNNAAAMYDESAESAIVGELSSTPTVADDGKLVDEDAAWLRDSARWLRMVGIGAHKADRLERIATRLEQPSGVREALAAFAAEYLPSGIRDTPEWNAVLAAAGVRTNG